MYGEFLSFIVIAHVTLSLTIIVLTENRDPVVFLSYLPGEISTVADLEKGSTGHVFYWRQSTI